MASAVINLNSQFLEHLWINTTTSHCDMMGFTYCKVQESVTRISLPQTVMADLDL